MLSTLLSASLPPSHVIFETRLKNGFRASKVLCFKKYCRKFKNTLESSHNPYPMPDAPSPEVSFQTVKSLALGLTQKPDYLIEKLIEKGDQVLLYGQPKVGKTYLAIQMACALVCQKRFLNWEIKSRRKVLYINFEMGERVFSDRISKFLDQPTSDFSSDDARVEFFDGQIRACHAL